MKNYILPDGSACGVLTIKSKPFFKRWVHKFFNCPTYWKSFVNDKSRRCPSCNKKIRCYWDGNDVEGHGVDYCNKCANELLNGGKDERDKKI